jgi:hypothetical protein
VGYTGTNYNEPYIAVRGSHFYCLLAALQNRAIESYTLIGACTWLRHPAAPIFAVLPRAVLVLAGWFGYCPYESIPERSSRCPGTAVSLYLLAISCWEFADFGYKNEVTHPHGIERSAGNPRKD